jgi:uncharacterized protein (DUF433 family)
MSGAWCFKEGRVPLSSLFEEVGSGASIEDFIDTFGGINAEDVTAALQHITTQLRARTESDLCSGIPEGGAINWRDYSGIEISEEVQYGEWVFKGTEHKIADLFEHITNGGTTHEYCEQAKDIQAADARELMEFVAARLDSM